MFIPIEKWHGCKNDFIVTWMIATDRDTVLESLKRLAPKVCNRDGSGIGADGILVIEVRSRKDIYPEALHIVNADGSLAENCGNGLRCAAMSVRRKSHKDLSSDIDGVTFQVMGRAIDCRFVGNPSQPNVAVTMPIPTVNEQNSWHGEVTSAYQKIASANSGLKGELSTVALGNPHLVAIVAKADASLAKTAGEPLQSSRGGDGINVHVGHIEELTAKDHQRAKSDLSENIGELYRVWPWERGVGATQACGTGACAVAVSAYEGGMVERSDWIAIDMPGGRLYAKQSAADEPVVLAGPAVFVFSGEIEI